MIQEIYHSNVSNEAKEWPLYNPGTLIKVSKRLDDYNDPTAAGPSKSSGMNRPAPPSKIFVDFRTRKNHG
jgi:hypothetical protein